MELDEIADSTRRDSTRLDATWWLQASIYHLHDYLNQKLIETDVVSERT